MDARLQPADITVDRGSSVTVTYEDGFVARFTIADLRQACPCAGCRNARDQGRPAYAGSVASLRIEDAEMVGAWALQFRWMDGHQAGIYPWERLRIWAESGAFDLPADSGLPADRGPSAAPPSSAPTDEDASFT